MCLSSAGEIPHMGDRAALLNLLENYYICGYYFFSFLSLMYRLPGPVRGCAVDGRGDACLHAVREDGRVR